LRTLYTGLRAWLVQRLSALFMLGFLVFLLMHFLFDPPRSYLAWHDWVRSRGVSLSALIFFAALLLHAWVGLRDVVLDYVRPAAARVAVFALLSLVLTAQGLWVARMLWLWHG
jgi:succinate dehydrogenase / fumarate reductase membrane anchor subunit